MKASGAGRDGEAPHVLAAAYPGEERRFFHPITIGSTPAQADAGAMLILNGTRTLTSSPFWDYPDGRIPFAGALSVLLDGAKQPRGIVETARIEIMPATALTPAMAHAYGEGERTIAWWRREIGAFYRASGERHGRVYDEHTPLIWEWLTVVRRF